MPCLGQFLHQKSRHAFISDNFTEPLHRSRIVAETTTQSLQVFSVYDFGAQQLCMCHGMSVEVRRQLQESACFCYVVPRDQTQDIYLNLLSLLCWPKPDISLAFFLKAAKTIPTFSMIRTVFRSDMATYTSNLSLWEAKT